MMSAKDSDEPIQRDPITRSSGRSVPPPDANGKPKVKGGKVSSTDMEPESPHGVGESVSRGAEDIEDEDGKEAGRKDTGTEGKAGRPTGTSDARDRTGVDPGQD
jgi:hypothetical protein